MNKQIEFFKHCRSLHKKNDYRKRFYTIPTNQLTGFNKKQLWNIVRQTGIQVCVFTTNVKKYIVDCLQSIETAMEGKKWILIVLADNCDDDAYELINRHRTSALYFIKERIPFAGNGRHSIDKLLLLSKPFHTIFPWLCFAKDRDGMHPLKIDFLLPYAIQNNNLAVIGDCLYTGENSNNESEEKSDIIKATDIECWQNHFEAGIQSLLFHTSLLHTKEIIAAENIEHIYDFILSRHLAAFEDQVVHVVHGSDEGNHHETGEKGLPAFWSGDKKGKEGTKRFPLKTNLESFSLVATKKLAEELVITLKSVRLYYNKPVYLICDTYVKDLVKRQKFKNIEIFVELNDDQVEKLHNKYFNRPYNKIWKFPPSIPNPPVLLKKMDVMKYALNNHKNTLLMDADIIFLAPIERYFHESLVVSPEINDYRVYIDEHGKEYFTNDSDMLLKKMKSNNDKKLYHYQLHDVFGIYNAGFLFTRDKGFPDWWKENFLHGSKFLEQEALNRVFKDFSFGIFSEQYNFGFWKLWRLTTRQFREYIIKNSDFLSRIKYKIKCHQGGNGFMFGAYFDLLRTMFSFEEIAKAAGFQSGHGIWFCGRPLQSFHLHIFYMSEHENLKSRWNFMKEFALYLIGRSRDEKHRELITYINSLKDERYEP